MGVELIAFFEGSNAFGTNQFAYRKGRGYKDVLAFNVMSWVWAMHCSKKTALYCSDVSEAFDRVDAEILLQKLEAKGISTKFLFLISSWPRGLSDTVCVEDQQ